MENYEIECVNEDVMENEYTEIVNPGESSSIGTGAAIAIGAGIATAIIGGVKLVKKLVAKAKAKRELRKVNEGDFIEVTDAQIEEVTSK